MINSQRYMVLNPKDGTAGREAVDKAKGKEEVI